MRTSVGSGRRRAGGVACGLLLVALATGCAQTVTGTPHAEGEGPPPPATTESVEAAPPTDFREPSGPPTVTVQPDETEPTVPGPLTTVPPPSTPPVPATPSPTGVDPPSTTAGAPSPRERGGAPSPAGGGGIPSSGEGDGGTPHPREGGGGTPSSGGGGGASTEPPRRTAPPPASPARTAPGPTGSGPPAAAPDTTLLTADVVDDECLLDAAAFAALLGGPVATPAETAIVRPDGTSTRSCYAMSRNGSATAAVNVYRVNRGTPAAFVRAAAGGRPLPGVGDAGVLLDTLGGTTMQVATPQYLVTVAVVDGSPTAERWAAAGRAVAAAVGRR